MPSSGKANPDINHRGDCADEQLCASFAEKALESLVLLNPFHCFGCFVIRLLGWPLAIGTQIVRLNDSKGRKILRVIQESGKVTHSSDEFLLIGFYGLVGVVLGFP